MGNRGKTRLPQDYCCCSIIGEDALDKNQGERFSAVMQYIQPFGAHSQLIAPLCPDTANLKCFAKDFFWVLPSQYEPRLSHMYLYELRCFKCTQQVILVQEQIWCFYFFFHDLMLTEKGRFFIYSVLLSYKTSLYQITPYQSILFHSSFCHILQFRGTNCSS